MPTYGSLNTTDTLQALRVAEGQTVAAYGVDEVWNIVNAAYIAHNELMREQLTTLCTTTVQRMRRYGNPAGKVMEEHDEYGQSQSQKGRGGSDLGFPLRKFGAALSWNNDYFLMTTAADFAAEITQIFDADVQNIVKQIKRAFYLPTNYTFEDMLIDHMQIPVKRLANSDGQTLPLGPDGQEFPAGAHNHYLARVGAAFEESDLAGLISHVTEHYTGGNVMVVIDTTQETAVRGFPDFVPHSWAGQIEPDNIVRTGRTIDQFNVFNRSIGMFRGVEIWVKPWAIANYVLCYITGSNIEKPLVVRTRGVLGPDGGMGSSLKSILNGGGPGTGPGMGDLRLVSQYHSFPMHATEYQREFGIAVQNRVAAAILYVGGTTYVAPAIA